MTAVTLASGTTPLPPSRPRSALDAGLAQDRTRKLIAPSMRALELMRQVSNLGMDDPIYSADQDISNQPKIFKEMADMQDEITIASDPTATYGDGIDTEVFEKNLSGVSYRRGSLSGLSLLESSFSSPFHASPILPRTFRSKLSVTTPTTVSSRIEDGSISLTSLSLDLEENVPGRRMSAGSSSSRLTGRRVSMGSSSSRLTGSRSAEDSFYKNRRRIVNSGRKKHTVPSSLMLEAAMAMRKEGSADCELIDKVILHNSLQEMSSEYSQKERVPPRRTFSAQEKFISPVAIKPSKNHLLNKSRVLPSIAMLFPEENDVSSRRASRPIGDRAANRKQSQDSAFSLASDGNPLATGIRPMSPRHLHDSGTDFLVEMPLFSPTAGGSTSPSLSSNRSKKRPVAAERCEV
jgi:hypothetical protein